MRYMGSASGAYAEFMEDILLGILLVLFFFTCVFEFIE